MPKTWLITGVSRGLGRSFARAALTRGDSVAGTVRDARSCADLQEQADDRFLKLVLDVRDAEAVQERVGEAIESFGPIDVLVNNAGYGQFGAAEEVTDEQLRAQMDTNFFGAVRVTRAVLPSMRAAKSGRIVQISSIGGLLAYPFLGAYHASKFALEGWSEALAHEVGEFGIRVTIVEPGGFTTDWRGDSAVWAEPSDAYAVARASFLGRVTGRHGDPDAAATALLAVVDASDPPLRILFGTSSLGRVPAAYSERLAEWQKWNHVTRMAQGHDDDSA